MQHTYTERYWLGGGGGGPKNHTVFRSNVCNSNIFMTKKDRCWILLQEYTKTQLRPSVGFRKLLRIDWLNAVGVARIWGGGGGVETTNHPRGRGGLNCRGMYHPGTA